MERERSGSEEAYDSVLAKLKEDLKIDNLRGLQMEVESKVGSISRINLFRATHFGVKSNDASERKPQFHESLVNGGKNA